MPAPVSIILPAFNAAGTVGEAIAAVRAQSFTDWELLLVDDGSTDETVAAAHSAAQSDRRIRILERPHLGIVGALQAGLRDARGEFIARMDADDTSHVDRLAEQTALLRRRPDLGLVSCLVEYGGDRVAHAGYALHVDWINSLVTPEDIALNRFVESPFAHPTVMFRRELVDRFGGYREGNFPEDYELWLRWLHAGVRMQKVLRPLLRWNDAPTRLSRTDSRYSPDRFFEIKAPWIALELLRASGTTRAAGNAPPPNLPVDAPGAPRASRPVWIWGAGRPTRKRASHLVAHGVSIAGFIDIDPKKCGRTVGGLRVVGPSELPSPADAFVLGYVSSRGARDLIRATLSGHGYSEGRDFLMCA